MLETEKETQMEYEINIYFKKSIQLLSFQAEDDYIWEEVNNRNIVWDFNIAEMDNLAVNKHDLHIRRVDQECQFTAFFFGFHFSNVKRLVKRKHMFIILRTHNNILSCWENIY